MDVKWGSRVLAVVTLSILAGSLVSGHQATSVEDSKRKIKFKTTPQYSELARSMKLSGKVKIEVVIASDGHVKSSRAVGGHPLLVQSCQEAVKDWRFEPGPEETTQIIEFDFRQ